MTNDKKRQKLNPLSFIALGFIFIGISYIAEGSSIFIIRIFQAAGAIFLILGIVIGSARLNSKRKL